MTLSFDERAKEWDTPQKIERAKKVAEFMKQKLTFKEGMTGFEYGCGTGLLSFFLLSQFKQITLAVIPENSPLIGQKESSMKIAQNRGYVKWGKRQS